MAYAPKRPRPDPCPVEATLDVIGGRWTSRVLFFLKQEPMTLTDLRACLPGIRHQVLRGRLRRLMDHGLIDRVADPHRHQHVRYTLRPEAAPLIAVMDAMRIWGEGRIGPWSEPGRPSGAPAATS